MECLSSGVAIRECKNVMLADLVQTLYHYTGWAELSAPGKRRLFLCLMLCKLIVTEQLLSIIR